MTGPPIAQQVFGSGNVFSGTGPVYYTVNNLPPAEADDRRDLLVLLRRVKQFWVEGVLEHSLHGAALLALGKETRPEAVQDPWERVLELPDQSSQALPAEKSLGDTFDERERLLLILGAPGAGKTTTLLALARDLVARAGDDSSQPVPVVFNLSTWGDRRQPLGIWLAEELKTKYYVPPREGRSWLARKRLLLLLDGLDEVKPDHRAACVEAINLFAQEVGIPGLGVCSRLQEYTALPVRLKLKGAICLHPLTLEQVDSHLARAGPSLSALRGGFRSDPVLRELGQSPLMLSVMSLAYQDLPPEALQGARHDTADEGRAHVFGVYVERMFKRRGKADGPYTEEQTKQWLSWLAQKMGQHSQAVFLLEGLQPSWLARPGQRWKYALSSRVVGLTLWAESLALATMTFDMLEGMGLAKAVAVNLGEALVVGLIMGSIVGVTDALQFERSNKPAERTKTFPVWATAVHIVAFVLLGGLFGIVVYLLELEPEGLKDLVSGGMAIGLGAGLVFALRRRGRGVAKDIQVVGSLRWSWVGARKSAFRAITWVVLPLFIILTLVIIARIVLVLPTLSWSVVIPVMTMFLIAAVVVALIGSIFGGVTRGIVERKASPNEGVRLTIRNAGLAGVAVALSCGGVIWLGFVLIGLIFAPGELNWLSVLELLAVLLMVGLVFVAPSYFFWFGGLDVIQHYTLRFILYRNGYTPRNYARFLDHAVRLIFLQRVGGGYIFVHRLLQEYFAALGAAGRRSPKGL